VPKSTTLDDRERPMRTVLHSEPSTKIKMKIDPHNQQQKCRPISLVSGGIRFMRIFAKVFPGEGASNDSGVVENGKIFSVFSGYFS